MAIQIGKYKRPGIFIEEFDNSIITTPVVEGITNMVIGVSKKGPVNTPIRITTVGDLESIFGQLDRGLERKGSFFHRTIQKMLESSPVFAINLLSTDDTLDTIEYKSLSASSGNMNDIEREGAYRRFFDTTGFWKRDTESFINLTKSNVGYAERAFSITNLSDRYVTVFVVKSARTGFDRTLIEYYGSQEKLPPYVNANDYASDYLVDVIIVGGDWSDYQNLAIDTRWSAYFNASGLVKSQLRNFANDRNVTLLSYYEGLSLIPYFRDSNGANIFIETTINRDTDRTGIFCAFNSDLVETDYYNGLLDLVGQTVAGANETEIDFLSYKETIAESIEITSVPLDLPGNVTALFGTASINGSFGYHIQLDHAFGNIPTETGVINNPDNRTGWFGEGYVYGVTKATPTLISSTTSISLTYNVAADAFAIIGGKKVPILGGTTSLVINASDYGLSSATLSFASAYVLDSTGSISLVSNLTGVASTLYALVGSVSFINGYVTGPAVGANDIVLGFTNFAVKGGIISTSSVLTNDVNINTNGFLDFKYGIYSVNNLNQYHIATQSTPNSGVIRITFHETSGTPNVKNYRSWRRFKIFNRLVDLIDSPNKNKMTLCLGPTSNYKKVSLADMTITNIVSSTTSNKSFILNTGLTDAELVDVLNGYFVLYTVDNEFILGSDTISTTSDVATSTAGVVARYSKFYSQFYDGIINTGDYFYANKVPDSLMSAQETMNIIFIDGEIATGTTSSYAGYNYVIFETTSNTDPDYGTYDQFSVPDSTLNTGSFTIANSANSSTLATNLGYISAAGSYYWAYEVVEEVVYEEVLNVSIIYDFLKKHYLKMYLNNDSTLDVAFMDEGFTSTEQVNVIANSTFYIQSAKSNFKQTVEIEDNNVAGYVQVPNKILITGSRYTEVRIGDFLAAYVDPTVTLEVGQVPRKLTRILSKKQYAGDTTLVEITCDARIEKTNYSGDYQTTRYTTIDNYATTYKAISLKGFRIRQASLPDGTENRQNSILNLVAKGTPLFKAVTNKEAIDFRYLVDSFGLGLTERSKQQLVDICGDRLDALGILNMPSMKSFKNSSSPTFVNREGVLQLEYVAKGGDPESSPAFLYSFGDGLGTTAVGYFMPYLTVSDNGRPVDVPPAAWVATTYMRKHISNMSGMTPWTIAAGVTNGRITNIISTEMDFTSTDIEFINEAQMNPIVFKRNRGNVIETENTGQTLYTSALSYLHVREVLIELERELSRMLLDFQWKFNTPDIRAEIKLRADVICETYVSKNGLYNYFNKMDEENNTSEIIDNQIGVIDTYVEPIKGMGIIVNNITILRTGAISAGGFATP
jgi:hypothetical protein